MSTKSAGNKNLMGKDAEIHLYFADDMHDRLRLPIPQLPKIECRLLKRVFSFTWCYLAELKKPLFLDIDGIKDDARKKMTAYYIMITPGYSCEDKKQDNLYLRLENEGKSDVIVAYLKDPNDVPNELLTGAMSDPYFKELPVIAAGTLTLKK